VIRVVHKLKTNVIINKEQDPDFVAESIVFKGGLCCKDPQQEVDNEKIQHDTNDCNHFFSPDSWLLFTWGNIYPR
jgi:hypothetical protein